MARRRTSAESTSDLYLRLGLSYDELESGFVTAERTIRDNMSRLSRQNTIIDLQAQVEIAGLDQTADATRILEIRQQALNRQLENQRDRVRLATAELRNMRERNGENSDQAQRAQVSLERERLELVRLEQQLRQTTEAQENFNNSGSDNNSGNFMDSINNLVNGVLDKIPPQLKAVAAGFVAVSAGTSVAMDKTRELIEQWRELETQAYELNMSVNDTEQFMREMKLAGGDIGDYEGYIRGITDAYVKGEWDDPEFIALRRYGAEIVDASGKLKDFQSISEEVFEAWEKADAEGNGIEFLQMTGGESGIRDAIQYFKRLKEAKEDASKIFDAGLDPDELHEAERAFNLLDEQMDEFKNAAVNLITPVTVELAELFFAAFHKGTEWLVDAKEALEEFGKSEEEIAELQAEREKKEKEREKEKDSEYLGQYSEKRKNDLKQQIKDLRLEIDYENEYQRAVAQANLERQRALMQNYISASERAAIEEKYNTDVEIAAKEHNEKIEEMTRETAAMQYEASHSAYEKEIYDIEQWKQGALDALGDYKDAIGDKNQWLKESAAITTKAAQQEAQAFQREMDRIKGEFKSIEEEIFELTHSQYDTEIMRAIQRANEIYQKTGDIDVANRYISAKVASIDKQAINNPDMLKRPDLQLVNVPDFSNYNALNAQIEEDMERYGKTLNEATDDVKDNVASLDLDSIAENVGNAFDSVDSSAILLADSLAKTSDKISNLNFDNKPTPTANNTTDNPPEANTPATPANNDNKPKNTIPSYNGINSADINKILQGFTDVNQRLVDLTKTAGKIANDLNQKQSNPPQITVSPNISLNLSGSYILTERMVNQLANDCTEQVANGVYDAVTRATNNLRIN